MSEETITNQIRALPKAELHLHLNGAFPLTYLQKIATDDAAKKEYANLVNSLDIIARGVPYHQAFQYFAPVSKLVNSYDKVEAGVIALAEELLADGVVYVEIRTGLKDFGQGIERYLLAILKGIENCTQQIKIKLLLSVRRDTDRATAQQIVDLAIRYQEQGVVGIDVSGDSTLGSLANIAEEIKRAKQHGLNLALHIGESAKEITTYDLEIEQADMLDQLQPDRIGHGVFLSPQARDWILNHTVPIEVCLTSSVLTGMIDHHKDHPSIAYYLSHNHPIVISTDDPLLFKTTLSEEYCKLMDLDGIDLESIKKIICDSFNVTF